MKRPTTPPVNDVAAFTTLDEVLGEQREQCGYVRLAIFWDGEFYCWATSTMIRNDRTRKILARKRRELRHNILKRGDRRSGGTVHVATVIVHGNEGRE